MGMAQLVVTAVLVEGRSKSEVARDYGVSRRCPLRCWSGTVL
jgi:transposase